AAARQTLVPAGVDAAVRCGPPTGAEPPRTIPLPAPLSAVTVGIAGDIVAAAADGKLYFLSPAGELEANLTVAAAPVIALARSRDGRHIAASSIKGAIAIIDHDSRRLERTLV